MPLSEQEHIQRAEFNKLCGMVSDRWGTTSRSNARLKEELLSSLRYTVSYPQELITQLLDFTVALAVAVIDDPPVQWQHYAPAEKLAYHEEKGQRAYREVIGSSRKKRFVTVYYADLAQESGMDILGQHCNSGKVMLSDRLKTASFLKSQAVAAHEMGHAIISDYLQRYHPAPEENWPTGLSWSMFFYKNDFYAHCPEEALVRQMAVTAAELLMPDSDEAKLIAQQQLTPIYREMNSACQFRQEIAMTPELDSASSWVNQLRANHKVARDFASTRNVAAAAPIIYAPALQQRLEF